MDSVLHSEIDAGQRKPIKADALDIDSVAANMIKSDTPGFPMGKSQRGGFEVPVLMNNKVRSPFASCG